MFLQYPQSYIRGLKSFSVGEKWYFYHVLKFSKMRHLSCFPGFYFIFLSLCSEFTAFYLFIYLFLAVLGLHCCAQAFSSCGEWGLVAVHRLLIVVASLVEHGLQAHGLQQLWCMGLVALQHVGSSRTRDRSRAPCIGRWILNHCATKEVPRGRF